MPLDVVGFVRRWQASQHTERSGAQQHFRGYLMPWVIDAIDHEPTKTCVLIAKMNGHEMESISLHVDKPEVA